MPSCQLCLQPESHPHFGFNDPKVKLMIFPQGVHFSFLSTDNTMINPSPLQSFHHQAILSLLHNVWIVYTSLVEISVELVKQNQALP